MSDVHFSHKQGVTVCMHATITVQGMIDTCTSMVALIRQSNASRRLRVWLSMFSSEYSTGLTRRFVLYCVLHSVDALCRVARAYVVLIQKEP